MSRFATLIKFIKFGFVGGMGLLINLAVTYSLTEYLRLWYFISYVIATFISWNIVFQANSFFTFAGHSKDNYWQRYATFMVGYMGLFLLNASIVFILTSLLHFYYLLSIIIATAITTISTFFFTKRFVYRDS